MSLIAIRSKDTRLSMSMIVSICKLYVRFVEIIGGFKKSARLASFFSNLILQVSRYIQCEALR